jgi:hypothetical protein
MNIYLNSRSNDEMQEDYLEKEYLVNTEDSQKQTMENEDNNKM